MDRSAFGVALCLVASGCGRAPDGANPDPRCHPLAVGDCLLPFPSSYYLAADPSTATGLRVAFPSTVLPLNQVGQPMDPARMNLADGFSPAGPILVNPKARVDETKLPPLADPTVSLAPEATVQLLRFDTGERVPLFAEVDHNVTTPDEDQLILIHPLQRLRPATRYLVVLRDLVDTAGKPIHVAPFDALLAGDLASDSRLRRLPDYAPIFALVEKHGIPRHALTLAWDFTTGSDTLLLSHLVGMRDAALAAADQMDLGYNVTATANLNDAHLAAEYVGTLDVPSFLVDDTAAAVLKLDDHGAPVLRGVAKFPFVIHVPKCAATANRPLPIMVFGHGLFGSARGEMSSGYEKELIDRLCMVQIGSDWIGLSENDIAAITAHVLADFSHFPIISDRLQQAQVNFLVMAHMAVRKLKSDPNLTVNNRPITDGKEIYYYGISQGGIEGNTFLALSPDVVRGAVNVPGGEYSIMLTRSADFRTLKGVLDITYPVQRDQEVLLALTQGYFDFSDPITFVPYSIALPLPDPVTRLPMAPRHVLMQESENDAQVPNLATRLVARTLGVPLLDPPLDPVFGIPVAAGPIDSALTQWDARPMPVPGPFNVPPIEGKGWMGYSAHEAIRRLPALVDQLAAFFRPDGKVTQTCTGPCRF